MILYFIIQLACSFVRSCFGHAMLKITQYITNDIKICDGVSEVNLKEAQLEYHYLDTKF